MSGPIYAANPNPRSDSAYRPADLEHLAVGNRGRLLDARRTPLRLTAVDPDRCEVEVEIEDFEDRGARWRLPVWEISRLELESTSALGEPDLAARLTAAVQIFNRPLCVEADLAASAETDRRVRELRSELRLTLAQLDGLLPLDEYVGRRHGDPRLCAVLERFLEERGLLALDQALTRVLVSNPRSGELVKGHAMALADLGLATFRGTIVRDPALFKEGWTRQRRAEHLLIRIAFVQELWAGHFESPVPLYRGAAFEGPPRRDSESAFASWTFSEEVADEHFSGGPTSTAAIKWRRDVDPTRLVMTFLETAAFNSPYREAEALLISDRAPASEPSGPFGT